MTHESRYGRVGLKFRLPFNEADNGNLCTLEGEDAGQGDVFTSHNQSPVSGFQAAEVNELLERAGGENAGRPGAREQSL
jgi:hypothetical protein